MHIHLPMQTEIYQESAVLVGLITPQQPEERAKEYLDELAFLADTAGATPVKFFVQKLDYPNPKTFVGPGKLKEIKEYLVAHDIGLVIFDDELSPGQLRNIERELNVLILDRTNLILDIFAKRAQTANAKTQVELAQLQYMLPRLTRLWTHLERQQGGIGMRGPGETQIETDRRIILNKISLLKQNLKEIDKFVWLFGKDYFPKAVWISSAVLMLLVLMNSFSWALSISAIVIPPFRFNYIFIESDWQKHKLFYRLDN